MLSRLSRPHQHTRIPSRQAQGCRVPAGAVEADVLELRAGKVGENLVGADA